MFAKKSRWVHNWSKHMSNKTLVNLTECTEHVRSYGGWDIYTHQATASPDETCANRPVKVVEAHSRHASWRKTRRSPTFSDTARSFHTANRGHMLMTSDLRRHDKYDCWSTGSWQWKCPKLSFFLNLKNKNTSQEKMWTEKKTKI